MNFTLFLIPIISALIGWLTNRVAIRMLFHPQNSINILGIKIQGLVPAKQKEMAQKFGEVVENDFFNSEDLMSILKHMNLTERFTERVDFIIDEKVKTSSILLTIVMKMPVVRLPFEAFIKRIKRSVKDSFVKDVESVVEEIVSHVGENIEIKEIVRRKIESFEVNYLEEVVLRLSKRELKAIEYLGGVLGFIVGLFQLALVSII